MLLGHMSDSVAQQSANASVTTSGTSSVKGTPAELIASTTRDTHLILVTASLYSAAATACQMAFDLLVGSATEDVLIADMLGGHAGLKQWWFPVFIPQGTRIAAQAAGARLSTAFNVQVDLFHYPGGPPFKVGSKVTTYGISTVPRGQTITPGTSGGEGSFVQMTASTTDNHFCLLPSFQPATDTTLTNNRYRIDIGVGAATEDVVLTDCEAFITGAEEIGMVSLPTFYWVPSGTRLAMRASNAGSTNDGSYDGVIHGVT